MDVEQELAALKATVQEIRDRQQIRDCIVRESRSRDRQDVAAIEACWWPDGIDEHGAVITSVPDYARRANMGHAMNFHMTSHNITNHVCNLEGDMAHCESYVVGGLFWLDGKKTTIAMGRYLDRLERRPMPEGASEWRLAVRKCTIEMTADCDASWVYSENVKGFLKARWDGEDPSYDRPYEPSSEGLRW